MLHIVYCFIILVLVGCIFYQFSRIEDYLILCNEHERSIKKLNNRLHDVINEYRRYRGAPTIGWTEFIRSSDTTLIPTIPLSFIKTQEKAGNQVIADIKNAILTQHEPKTTVKEVKPSSVTGSSASHNRSARNALDDDVPSFGSSSYSSSSSSSYSSSSDSSSSCDSSSSSSSSCD